ncbi:MAG: hypothetical protein IPK53_15340 [bacterium]|nr:hypothetical protein [bacterium]
MKLRHRVIDGMRAGMTRQTQIEFRDVHRFVIRYRRSQERRTTRRCVADAIRGATQERKQAVAIEPLKQNCAVGSSSPQSDCRAHKSAYSGMLSPLIVDDQLIHVGTVQ